ncbi:MAG: TonB-dependent receptor [Gemmatimonadales bacterium]|nr:TonB-dependent receptor [Gemmatimonadales bacterium]
MSRRLAWLLLGVLVFGGAEASRAQVVAPPTDSARVADSLRKAADTLSTADRVLQAQGQERVLLRTLDRVGTGTLLTPHSRIVLTRDSIDWATAQTVSELIARVPGVYLWRGGWQGRAEMPNYLGRGATSVEYLLDGVPYLPVGPDSLAADPSLWSLSLLDRVEVERGAGQLRVMLFSRRHDRAAPRTRIGITSGDRSIARYLGTFERRYPSGIGLGLGAEYFAVNAPNGGTGGMNSTNAWIQLGYLPSPTLGVQFQLQLQDVARDTLYDGEPGEENALSGGVAGTRSDAQLRFSWQRAPGDLGSRADLIVGRTSWSSDSVAHQVGRLGAVVAHRRPTWSSQLTVWHNSEWTPLDARLALGWAPFSRMSAAVELVEQAHSGDRRSRWGTARVGFRAPILGITLSGVVRDGERVQAPADTEDQGQRFTDLEATASVEGRRLGAEVGMARLDGWRPIAYRDFMRVASLRPVESSDWVTAKARVAVTSWLTMESLYEHAIRGDLPDGTPPHHGLTTATIRSRFLRNFPSGIFEMKLQGMVETWSPGVIGRTTEGAPIAIPGRTLVRGWLQFKIGPFIAYYDRVNFQAVRGGTVTRYPIPGLASSFGVRWDFLN